VPIDGLGLAFVFQNNLSRMLDVLWAEPEDDVLMEQLNSAIGLASVLPFEVNLWNVQNSFYELMRRVYPDVRKRADMNEEGPKHWVKSFLSVGEKLRVRVA
jgi:hypothetical protein